DTACAGPRRGCHLGGSAATVTGRLARDPNDSERSNERRYLAGTGPRGAVPSGTSRVGAAVGWTSGAGRVRARGASPPAKYPDRFVVNGRSKQIEVLRRQQATRKAEVAAIVPYLMQIRAQAHFRFNRMERFRTAFHAACKEVERRGRKVLPLAFSYEEGTASS